MSNSDLAHHTLFPRRETEIKPNYTSIILCVQKLVNYLKFLEFFEQK